MAGGREEEARTSQAGAPDPGDQGGRGAPTLTVKTLGQPMIRWDGCALDGITLRKTEALLIYLALSQGPQGRSHLAGLLWGDSPEDRARGNLRHALWDLRRKLEPAAFESDRHSIGLSPHVRCHVDALDFEDEMERAGRCRRGGDAAAMIEHLEAALALYEGDFLARFDLPGCPEFDEWAVRQRAWLRERALDALTRLVAHFTREGAYGQAVRHARKQLSLDPWREETHRELMRLLALTGQRSAALAQYETCRRLLDAELGLEPLEETTALYKRLVGWEAGSALKRDVSLPADLSTSLPFTGRGEEHARLLTWWDASRRGAGNLTLVEGEAGVGKTRLVEEVTHYARADGATVLRGRCYEFAAVVPYQPIAEALRVCLSGGGEEREGRDAEGRRSGGEDARRNAPGAAASLCLGSLAPVWLSELSRLLPELRQLRPDLPEPVQVSGEAARQRLFEAVARFLSAYPADSLLLFLDDLQWADPSTLDLLHYLVRQLVDRPVWIAGTYRPEEVGLSHRLTRLRQGLGRDRMANHLTLEPLPPQAVEKIARSLVGHQEAAALGDFLYRESEGNPFFLTEVVSDLQERGALQARGELGDVAEGEGHWHWTEPPALKVLPPGVRDVILQRVGRLSERAQHLLSVAAVVGWQFDVPLLQAAVGRDADAVGRAVDEWLARRLVQPSPVSNARGPVATPRYIFSHDKIRAVVYDAIAVLRRQMLHHRVAEALEQSFGDRIEEHVGLLAHHWGEAQDLEKAAAYHLRAGDQARLVYAHQEAVEHYRRALKAFKKQGSHQRAARTLMKLGLTYHHAFDFQRARRAYDEGLALWQRARPVNSTAAPTPGRYPKQTLRVRWVEPTTLDPALVPDEHTRCLMSHLFSGLVALSPELDVVPDVARAWEVSESGRRFVFHLRDDAVWSDGTSVLAGDFEYAWKRILDPSTGSPSAGFLCDVKGARAFHRGEGEREDVGVHARDPLTLIVELESPVGYFLQLLTHVACSPVPRHVAQDRGEGWTEHGVFVNNGPFQLEAWNQGVSLVLTRNPTYHGRFGGNLKRVKILPLMDWSARLAAYDAGDLDVLGMTYFPAEERERARQRHAGEYVSRPRLETCYLAFDTSRAPFDDARVRRAFAMATDRQALAGVVLRGCVSPATGGFVPPGMPGHSAGIGLAYDPQRARQLLAEAGYPAGRSFPPVDMLAFRAVQSWGDYLVSQWREVLGVATQMDALPWAAFLDKLGREPPQILVLMWVADYPDPDNFLRVCRDRTWGGWQDATYDRLIGEARLVMTQEERMRRYRRADRVLVEDVPILPLTYEQDHLLVKPWVRYYPTSPTQSAYWKDAVIEPH